MESEESKDQIMIDNLKLEQDNNSSETSVKHKYSNALELQLVLGDITEESTEGIVNAANEYLMHGAGIALALQKKGGEYAYSALILQNCISRVKRLED